MYQYNVSEDIFVYSDIVLKCASNPTPSRLDLADKYVKRIFKIINKFKPDSDGVKRRDNGRLVITVSPCGVMKIIDDYTKHDYYYISDENRHVLTDDEIKDMTHVPTAVKPDFTDAANKVAKRNQNRKSAVVKPTASRFIKAFEVCINNITDSEYHNSNHVVHQKCNGLTIMLLMLAAYRLKIDINKNFKYCMTGVLEYNKNKKYTANYGFEVIDSLKYLEIQEKVPNTIERSEYGSVLERRAISFISYFDAVLKLFVPSLNDEVMYSRSTDGDLTIKVPTHDSVVRFLELLDDEDIKTSIDWTNPYRICSTIHTIMLDAKIDYEEIVIPRAVFCACRDNRYNHCYMDGYKRRIEPKDIGVLKTELMRMYKIFDSYRVNNPIIYSILRDIELVNPDYMPSFKHDTICKPYVLDMRLEEWQNIRGSNNIVASVQRLIRDEINMLVRSRAITYDDCDFVRQPVVNKIFESYMSLPDDVDNHMWDYHMNEPEEYMAVKFDIMDFDKINEYYIEGLKLSYLRNVDSDYNINRQHNNTDIKKTLCEPVVRHMFADKVKELVGISYEEFAGIKA